MTDHVIGGQLGPAAYVRWMQGQLAKIWPFSCRETDMTRDLLVYSKH